MYSIGRSRLKLLRAMGFLAGEVVWSKDAALSMALWMLLKEGR